MNYYTLLVCLIFLTLDLSAQKHQFGATIGIQRQGASGIGIDNKDANIYFQLTSRNQPHFGLYYRHKLGKFISLETAPLIYFENIDVEYFNPSATFFSRKATTIKTVNLYLPFLLRLELGHKISFSLGGGPILFLDKMKTASVNLLEEDRQLFENLLQAHNNWPIMAEMGLSYGIGRFSINGKYAFRVSEVFDDINIKGQDYSIDFKMDAFYLDLSYRIF